MGKGEVGRGPYPCIESQPKSLGVDGDRTHLSSPYQYTGLCSVTFTPGPKLTNHYFEERKGHSNLFIPKPVERRDSFLT